jgi:secondary thiamine-phosphate synthase enzyme
VADRIRVRTPTRETMVDITDDVLRAIGASRVHDGTAHLWTMHTTCALTVNEGFDPDVVDDIVSLMRRLVPQHAGFRHAEGNSDSHVKTCLFGPGLTLIVEQGRPLLGTWQRIFLCEWDGPRTRDIAILVRPA